MRFLVLMVLTACVWAQDGALGVLARNCAACHGAAAMGGLDLRSREGLLKGGKRGAAVRPGDASGSLLIQAVERRGDVVMPPGKKGLERAEVALLREWVQAGARWEGELRAEPSWWSFKKPMRAAVPAGASNPVDAFVNAKLAAKGLRAVSRADRRTLIRRAYFDLHGLPPSPAEVAAFEKETSPKAWETLVDKLLASPRYGERWGRHWLDVVRYADTGGFETDIYFPNAWRYRDYVIQSFNADKPYDQFVKEQVAGDELWPDDLDLNGTFDVPKQKQAHLEAKIATGMYTIGPVYHEAALFGDQVRYEWLTDVVDTTGEAFLGLTLGCSRCHDHKYDPLTRRDYHAMMAVFAASDEREVPVVSRFAIFGYKSGYPNQLKVEEIKSAIGRIERGARERVVNRVKSRFPAEVLAAYGVKSQERTPAQRALAAQVEKALTEAGLGENAQGKDADIPYTDEEVKRRAELIVELGKAALRANPLPQTATVLGRADRIPDVHLTSRGDWRAKGEVIAPGLPAALSGGTAVDVESRRKSLALWLASADHPLTARVMVNRAWHWHFGRGLVGTPNDFGRQGDEPTHPELLDWLTTEFVREGWSLKKLHRLLMLSETYQRASTHDAASAGVDAGNRYLWRFHRQRVDAESLRDAVLAVAGTLNLKMGGRPVIPPLSAEEYTGLWARNQWPEAMDEREHTRRSVYLYVKRSFPMPMLQTFDAPDSSVSCARRDATTVAPQALTLMNSSWMVGQARRLGARVRKEAGDDRAGWVETLWRLALGRGPSEGEAAKAAGYLNEGDANAALDRLCLVTLNMNEFLYVD